MSLFKRISQTLSWIQQVSNSQNDHYWINFFFKCTVHQLGEYYPKIRDRHREPLFKIALTDQIKTAFSWYERYEKSLLFWSWFKDDPDFQRHLHRHATQRPSNLGRYCAIEQLISHCSDALALYLKRSHSHLTPLFKRGAHKKVRSLFDLYTGQFVAGGLYTIATPIQNICDFIAHIPPQLTTKQFENELYQHSFSNREKSLLRWLYWCPHLPLAPLFTIDHTSNTPLLIQALADYTLADWIESTDFTYKIQQHCCLSCLTILAKLHRQGYAHRDIKPNNILVYNHQLKWGDLDNMTPIKDNPPNTNTYAAAFKAPELSEEKSWDSFKADAYALGVTLLCILTQSTRPSPATMQWAQHPTSSPSPLPRQLTLSAWPTIINGLLHQNPSQRLSVIDASKRIHYTFK